MTRIYAGKCGWAWVILLALGLLGGSAALAGDTACSALRGDGRTDDTAALQLELNKRKGLELAPGTYRITKPLQLPSGSTLSGTGQILVDFDNGKMDASNAALVGQGRDIRVEGISIKKRFQDGSYGVGVLIDSGSKNVVVRNVEISGYSARYGIHLVETDEFEVSGCYIHDFLVDTEADMILDSPAGLRVTRSTNGVISNNRILRIDVGAKGYASRSPVRPEYGRQGHQSDCMTVMQSRSITITGNVLDTSGEGLDLLLSQDCAVSGNSIRNIWLQGIKMLGVRHTSLTGNTLRDCQQGIGLAEHVAMKTECVGNTIIGNTVLDTGAPGTFRIPPTLRTEIPAIGIDMDGRCVDNVVAHNTILDTQPQKTMKRAIRQSHPLRNVVEGNNLGG